MFVFHLNLHPVFNCDVTGRIVSIQSTHQPGCYIVVDKVYNNRHLLVCSLESRSSDSSDNLLAARTTSFKWASSLELIKSFYNPIKNGVTSAYIFPLLVDSAPIERTDHANFWPLVQISDSPDESIAHELEKYVFQLRVSRKVAQRSAAIAKSFNKKIHQSETDHYSECEGEGEGGEEEDCLSSDEDFKRFDSTDTDRLFEESLGDLAEDAEQRNLANDANANTAYLSALECHTSIFGEEHMHDVEDSNSVGMQEAQTDARLVDSVERQRLDVAIGRNALDLSNPAVMGALRAYQAEGMSEEAATLEAGLNSDKVMGNTDYDCDTAAGTDATGVQQPSGS